MMIFSLYYLKQIVMMRSICSRIRTPYQGKRPGGATSRLTIIFTLRDNRVVNDSEHQWQKNTNTIYYHL